VSIADFEEEDAVGPFPCYLPAVVNGDEGIIWGVDDVRIPSRLRLLQEKLPRGCQQDGREVRLIDRQSDGSASAGSDDDIGRVGMDALESDANGGIKIIAWESWVENIMTLLD
jgi:hypothetical protein